MTGEITTYLFARPTFVSGMARVLDMFGVLNMYNFSSTPTQADYRAIKSDWLAVGVDIHDAIVTFEAQHGKPQETTKARP